MFLQLHVTPGGGAVPTSPAEVKDVDFFKEHVVETQTKMEPGMSLSHAAVSEPMPVRNGNGNGSQPNQGVFTSRVSSSICISCSEHRSSNCFAKPVSFSSCSTSHCRRSKDICHVLPSLSWLTSVSFRCHYSVL